MTNSGEVRSVTIELVTSCRATPETVWSTIVDDIESWWGEPYVQSPERTSLALDLSLGGQLVEWWGPHGGSAWATVRAFRRPWFLSFDGTFMMTDALAGSLDLTLEDDGGGTTISLTQRAIGPISGETLQSWHAGWSDLLERLAKHAIQRAEVAS